MELNDTADQMQAKMTQFLAIHSGARRAREARARGRSPIAK